MFKHFQELKIKHGSVDLKIIWNNVYSLIQWFQSSVFNLRKHVYTSTQFSSVQLLSCIQLFVTPWTAACQTSLPITIFWSLPKFTSIESVRLSNRLILCCPLFLLPWNLSHHQTYLYSPTKEIRNFAMRWNNKNFSFWWDVKYCSRETCKNWEHLDKVQQSHFGGNTGVWKPIQLD